MDIVISVFTFVIVILVMEDRGFKKSFKKEAVDKAIRYVDSLRKEGILTKMAGVYIPSSEGLKTDRIKFLLASNGGGVFIQGFGVIIDPDYLIEKGDWDLFMGILAHEQEHERRGSVINSLRSYWREELAADKAAIEAGYGRHVLKHLFNEISGRSFSQRISLWLINLPRIVQLVKAG